MKNNSNKLSLVTGFFFIIIGLTLNEFVLVQLLSPDGVLETHTRIIVWFVNFVFVFSGFLVIRYNLLRINFKEILFCFIIFVSFLFLLEGSFRIHYFILDKQNDREMRLSQYLGWENKANYRFIKNLRGYGEIVYSTKEYGFRYIWRYKH
jgi:hypothetical protein